MNIEEAWEKAKARLDAMTDEERAQTLVDSGILLPNGEVAEPYKNVIKSTQKTYKQWNAEGRRIHKGSKAVGRTESGELLFTQMQTYKPDRNNSAYFNQWQLSAHLGVTGEWDNPPH